MKSLLLPNFFRQINSLVIYLVNELISRNFCQKSVRVNFRNLLLKIKKLLLPNFSCQINSLVIYLVNALISRNFCQESVRVNFRNFHIVFSTLCKYVYILSQILREIKVDESKVSKYVILAHGNALNFDFDEYSHFLKAENP